MKTSEERRGKFVWSMKDVVVLHRAADHKKQDTKVTQKFAQGKKEKKG